MQSALYEAEHEAFRAMLREFLAKEVVPHHAAWEEAGVERYYVQWFDISDLDGFARTIEALRARD